MSAFFFPSWLRKQTDGSGPWLWPPSLQSEAGAGKGILEKGSVNKAGCGRGPRGRHCQLETSRIKVGPRGPFCQLHLKRRHCVGDGSGSCRESVTDLQILLHWRQSSALPRPRAAAELSPGEAAKPCQRLLPGYGCRVHFGPRC